MPIVKSSRRHYRKGGRGKKKKKNNRQASLRRSRNQGVPVSPVIESRLVYGQEFRGDSTLSDLYKNGKKLLRTVCGEYSEVNHTIIEDIHREAVQETDLKLDGESPPLSGRDVMVNPKCYTQIDVRHVPHDALAQTIDRNGEGFNRIVYTVNRERLDTQSKELEYTKDRGVEHMIEDLGVEYMWHNRENGTVLIFGRDAECRRQAEELFFEVLALYVPVYPYTHRHN